MENRPDSRVFDFLNFFLKKAPLFQRFPLSKNVLRISEPCFEFPKGFFLDFHTVARFSEKIQTESSKIKQKIKFKRKETVDLEGLLIRIY